MDEQNDKPLAGALLAEDNNKNSKKRDQRSRGVAGDGKAETAKALLTELLDRMDIDVTIEIRSDEETEIVLDLDGKDAGRAIGKKGATLDALQYFTNKAVNRRPDGRRHVVLDSGDYRARHEEKLVSMADREAQRAVRIGKKVSLRPMNSRDRRIVHMSLAKFEGVTTESHGEGVGRRIQIIPAR